jgi:hypothetical protein
MMKDRNHSEIQKSILEYLQLVGIDAIPIKSQGQWDPKKQIFRKKHGRKGIADILAVIPPNGKSCFIEVKTANDSLSLEQRMFQEDMLRAGALAFVARSVDDVLDNLASYINERGT